jgi:K+-transporting ATPase ATPase C chain
MRRQFLPAILTMVVFILLFGLAYPLAVTGVSQLAFNNTADGSLIEVDGTAVGSELIGQAFVDEDGNPIPGYFQSRPSAASGATGETTAGYDPTLSLGSNLGPDNPCFVTVADEPCADDEGNEIAPVVVAAVQAYLELNDLPPGTPVPVDAVTSSGSGLDPDISIANAKLQAARVAEARGLDLETVLDVVEENTSDRDLGFLGEKRVNVLKLNLALDRLGG